MKHGMMVNLYQVREMFKDSDPGLKGINNVYAMLKESFISDKEYNSRKYGKMTFAEYVDAKRHFIAGVLGVDQYL